MHCLTSKFTTGEQTSPLRATAVGLACPSLTQMIWASACLLGIGTKVYSRR